MGHSGNSGISTKEKDDKTRVTLTLAGRVGGDVVGARRGAADAVGRPRRVGDERLAEGREGALELARQRRQVVDHQRQLSKSKPTGPFFCSTSFLCLCFVFVFCNQKRKTRFVPLPSNRTSAVSRNPVKFGKTVKLGKTR